jgi:biopolymer transport protein ExbD
MTRHDKHRNDIVADINITPFTDVVLVLLIIFMVAAPIIVGSGVKVDVPKAHTSNADVEKFLTVTIDAQENIYLNEKKITIEQLSKMIRGASGQGAKVLLKVNGDKSIKYRTVISVISAARDAGVVRYLLVTQKIKAGAGG